MYACTLHELNLILSGFFVYGWDLRMNSPSFSGLLKLICGSIQIFGI